VKADLVEELIHLVRVRSEVFITEAGAVKRRNYREAAEAVKKFVELLAKGGGRE